MNALMNLKIGTRLALTLGGVLVAMCAVAAAGMWGINSLFAIATRVLEQDIRLAQQASEIQNLVLQERRYEKDAYINLGEADKLAS
ncbi:MAG TPA: hypothetical protein VJ598_11120, partial [Albitalea sp.]|nr:hypothetical protein [Albitalea sp.]